MSSKLSFEDWYEQSPYGRSLYAAEYRAPSLTAWEAALDAFGREPTRVTDEMVNKAVEAYTQVYLVMGLNPGRDRLYRIAMRAALEAALFRAPSREHRCECQPPYHRAGCIWSAPKEQVTPCLDSSLCECGREHEPGEVNPAESPSRKSRLELRLEDAHWARYRFSERN
ncbi:MAG: hypothetical protein KGL39_58710, partial [Patescibacteria group bacterium]|nr:hypothetical protein [Patescibacteria group bacterium]